VRHLPALGPGDWGDQIDAAFAALRRSKTLSTHA